MSWMRKVVREIFRLFVDDGSFAVAILLWLAVFQSIFSHFKFATRWSGVVLFVGLSFILIESATRYSRRTRKPKQP